MDPWLPGAHIRSRLDASEHIISVIIDARTDTVTMTRSFICMHAPQIARHDIAM